ncbi:MAG: histidine kinase, partial [Bacteroidota bacterium]
EITYAGLNYIAPEENKYQYRFSGYSNAWIDVGTRRVVNLPNLDPGTYTFEVKAANNDGLWNPKIKRLTLQISPAWWQTTWFYLGLVLVSLLIVGLLIRQRINKIRTEARLKAEYEKQLVEIQSAALRAQMNPHFLFNCLNSINRFVTRNEPLMASEYLGDFASLIRRILNNSAENLISLAEELETIRLYIGMEQLRFEDKFEYVETLHPDVEVDFVRVPPMIFQPFLENAIWHGLMHKEGKGTLQLRIVQDENYLTCVIEDDGIGREKAAQMKRKSATNYRSMGMQITEDRLNNLKKRADIDSVIEILDLSSDLGEVRGTRVTITVPI